MKRVSNQTAELLRKLRGRPAWLPFQRREVQRKVQHIQRIATSGEPAAIAPLLAHLFDSPSQVAVATADAVAELLAACTPDDLLELTTLCRWQTEFDVGRKWLGLRPRSVAGLPLPRHNSAAVLGMASFHGNGYVREAAVRCLDGIEDGSEVPFLLIRLNDWVEAVRNSARQAIERRLQRGELPRLADHLYFVFRLSEQQRSDHSSIVAAVVQNLARPENHPILRELISSENRYIRRMTYQRLMQLPGDHLLRLVQAGLGSDDPVVRLWTVRTAPASFDSVELAEFLQGIERDRFMAVRREALRVHAEHLPDTSQTAMTSALLDRSTAVREEARFQLRKQGVRSCDTFYREAVGAGCQIEAALLGLGEMGTESDASMAVPFLKSSGARVRRAAVYAVGRLAPQQHVAELWERITDDSPRVAKEAAKALRNCGHIVDAAEIWAVYQADSREHVHLALLQLLDQLGAWHKLPYLIRLSSGTSEHVVARAKSLILGIVNRVFTRPSPEEKRLIAEALADTAGSLDPAYRAELKAWIDGLAK